MNPDYYSCSCVKCTWSSLLFNYNNLSIHEGGHHHATTNCKSSDTHSQGGTYPFERTRSPRPGKSAILYHSRSSCGTITGASGDSPVVCIHVWIAMSDFSRLSTCANSSGHTQLDLCFLTFPNLWVDVFPSLSPCATDPTTTLLD